MAAATAEKPVTDAARPRFEVIRDFSEYQAGQIIEQGADWPYHRVLQLQRQRYLRPLNQEPDAPRRVRGA